MHGSILEGDNPSTDAYDWKMFILVLVLVGQWQFHRGYWRVGDRLLEWVGKVIGFRFGKRRFTKAPNKTYLKRWQSPTKFKFFQEYIDAFGGFSISYYVRFDMVPWSVLHPKFFRLSL